MNILIVEDKEENRYFLESLLKGSGYNVISAVNGIDALKKLHSNSINLIISDILMPEMDGFQLLKNVKDNNTLKNIPFVFYTATYVDKKDMEFGLKLGAVEYIKKPADPEEFLVIIQNIIGDVKSGKLKPKKSSKMENKEVFKLYSQRLVNKLEKKMQDLEIEITERKKVEIALKKRMKELRFLYNTTWISARPGFTLDEMYRQLVNHIPAGWQFPEITGGCITISGKVYKTKNFKETKWMQRENIHVKDEIIGTVEVCYLKEKPDEDEGPFLKEERELIGNFAKQLGGVIKRKQTEDILKDSEERLKLIFENAPDAIFLNDLKGNFIDGNKSAENILGFKREELIGKNFLKLKLLSVKDLPKTLKSLAKSAQGKKTGPDEWLLNRKDGSQVLVEISSYPVKIKDKTVVLGIARDITERKRIEKEINFLAHTTRSITECISITDLDNNIIFVNDAFLKTYGYKENELIGKNINIVHSKKNPKEILEKIKPETRKDSWQGELINKRKDGSEFPIFLSTSSVQDEKNISIALVGVATDISKRKQTEEELNKHRQHLEKLVEERTTELEAANKELEAFSYSVSHDLRAPLRAIDGFTSILIEDYASKLDEEGKRLGSTIHDNALKMGRLIDDLLAFSRVGRASMTFTNIDMKNMVNAIYHETTSAEERKRIKFTVTDLPQVKGDNNLIRQVWVNLISNAVKFSSNGKQAVISVTCKDEKDKVTYCIKDNGAGFNMKYVDKLFGVFQRLHSEKDYKGTGIGLSLVQRIIHRHDGNVWAEGEVDKGASFYFSLPKK